MILADSPVAYYRLGEASGIVANDSSGNDVHGTYSPNSSGSWTGGTLEVSGAVIGSDTAATFNGTTGRVEIASVFGITDFPFTCEAWIKTSDTSGSIFGICGLYGGTSVLKGIGMENNKPHLNNSNANRDLATSSVNDGQWHHVVGVFISTASRKIYVDGIEDGSFTGPVNFLEILRAGIGRNEDASPGQYFPGTIDEVAFYNVALTPEQIAYHYAVGSGS